MVPDLDTMDEVDNAIATARFRMLRAGNLPSGAGERGAEQRGEMVRVHASLADLYGRRSRMWREVAYSPATSGAPLLTRAAEQASAADREAATKHARLATYWQNGGPR